MVNAAYIIEGVNVVQGENVLPMKVERAENGQIQLSNRHAKRYVAMDIERVLAEEVLRLKAREEDLVGLLVQARACLRPDGHLGLAIDAALTPFAPEGV